MKPTKLLSGVEKVLGVVDTTKNTLNCLNTEITKLRNEDHLNYVNVNIAHGYCAVKNGKDFFLKKLRLVKRLVKYLKVNKRTKGLFESIEKKFDKNDPLQRIIKREVYSKIYKKINTQIDEIIEKIKLVYNDNPTQRIFIVNKLLDVEKNLDLFFKDEISLSDVFGSDISTDEISLSEVFINNSGEKIDDIIIDELQTLNQLLDENDISYETCVNDKSGLQNIFEYLNHIDFVNKLNTVNTILSIMVDKRNIVNFAFDQIINKYEIGGDYGLALKAIFHNHKLRFRNLVDIAGECCPNVPILSVHSLVNDFKHNASKFVKIGDSLNVALDVLVLFNPEFKALQVIFKVAFNIINLLDRLRTHTGTETISRIGFARTSKLSLAHCHKSWKVKLDNDFFDIHVEVRAKHHTTDNKDGALDKAKIQAKKQLRDHFFTKTLIPYKTFKENGEYEYCYTQEKENIFDQLTIKARLDYLYSIGKLTYAQKLAIENYYGVRVKTIFEDIYNWIFYRDASNIDAEKTIKNLGMNDYKKAREVEKYYENMFFNGSWKSDALILLYYEKNILLYNLSTPHILGVTANSAEIMLVNIICYLDEDIKLMKKDVGLYFKTRWKNFQSILGLSFIRNFIYLHFKQYIKLFFKTAWIKANGIAMPAVGFALSSLTNMVRFIIDFSKNRISLGKMIFGTSFSTIEIGVLIGLQYYLVSLAISVWLIGLAIIGTAIVFGLVYRLISHFMKKKKCKMFSRYKQIAVSNRYLNITKSDRYLTIGKSDRFKSIAKSDRQFSRIKEKGKSCRYSDLLYLDDDDNFYNSEKTSKYDCLKKYSKLSKYLI